MDLRFSVEDEAFRAEVRAWLDEHLVDDFAALGDAGGPGREHEGFETRREWERLLEGPLTELLTALTSPSPRSRELRQNNPFAGVLSEEERRRVLGAANSPKVR